MDASQYKAAIVAFIGTPTLAEGGLIDTLWDWQGGYAYDLRLQSLYVKRDAIQWAMLNLDTDPVYKADDEKSLARREARRAELQALLYEARNAVATYTPAGGGSAPAAGELTTTKLIDASNGWTDPNSPSYYGSPFHYSNGQLKR